MYVYDALLLLNCIVWLEMVDKQSTSIHMQFIIGSVWVVDILSVHRLYIL